MFLQGSSPRLRAGEASLKKRSHYSFDIIWFLDFQGYEGNDSSQKVRMLNAQLIRGFYNSSSAFEKQTHCSMAHGSFWNTQNGSFWSTDSAKSLQNCSLIAFCGSFWNTDRLQLAQGSTLRLFFPQKSPIWQRSNQASSGSLWV